MRKETEVIIGNEKYKRTFINREFS